MYHQTRIIVRWLYLGSKPVDYHNFKKDGNRLNRDYQKQDFFSLTITPSDGNCMFHSLADQLVRLDPGTPYNCYISVTSVVVLNLLEQLETDRIIWINEDESIEETFFQSGHYQSNTPVDASL